MPLIALVRREMSEYFLTQLAWLYLSAFVFLGALGTFNVGDFLARGQADLLPFFDLHPWLHLLLASALAMRQWVEERRRGTLELLLTLPLRLGDAVLGKFLAAWLLVGLALILTTPIWATLAWLGAPDHGVVFAGYLGSWLVAGVLLAIGGWASATASSQVSAFTITLVLGLILLLIGSPNLLATLAAWLPDTLLSALSTLSITRHFEAITRGVLDLRDLCYFVIMISTWLTLTALTLRQERDR